jgi:hypothetical protein
VFFFLVVVVVFFYQKLHSEFKKYDAQANIGSSCFLTRSSSVHSGEFAMNKEGIVEIQFNFVR